MPSSINASTAAGGGIISSADSSGVLELQTAGTTAISITSGQVVSFTKDASISGLTVGKGGGAVDTNTVVGAANALAANTSGTNNNAFGRGALQQNTTGALNSAFGWTALLNNTTGSNNTAIGNAALVSNTTASNNTAVGFQAGFSVTTGFNLTFVGRQTGYSLTTGSESTAVGHGALFTATTALYNTAIGQNALRLTTGNSNTAVGLNAGFNLSTGVSNTFVGGLNTSSQGAGEQMTTGSRNTIIGPFTGNQGGLDIRTANNHIVLSDGDGNPRLYLTNSGFLFCQGVYDRTTGSAANIHIGAGGDFFRSTSSIRYKKDIQNATYGLAELLQLRPVTYKGKAEFDGDTVFGGLIAEEVDAVGLTEFVQYAEDGSPDSLAYGNMVSLCVKAIQELNAKVEAQSLEIATLKGQ